ncbi:MAG: HEAT repeat domain-containing protein [Sedimentisphaerales bacterium]
MNYLRLTLPYLLCFSLSHLLLTNSYGAIETPQSPSQLAKIALEDKNYKVRMEAIAKLTDQKLLTRIAVDEAIEGLHKLEELRVRYAAINKVFDSNCLSTCLSPQPYYGNNVRLFAQLRLMLRDPVIIKHTCPLEAYLYGSAKRRGYGPNFGTYATTYIKGEILKVSIKNKTDGTVILMKSYEASFPGTIHFLGDRRTSLKLPDIVSSLLEKYNITHSGFADIASNAKDGIFRKIAVAKLTDQKLLGKIAGEDESHIVRMEAVANLTDPNFLRIIATEDKSWEVRVAAVEKLKDQKLLEKIAVKDLVPNVRRKAVANLIDQPLLWRIAVKGRDSSVCEAAVAKLTDQNLLFRVAQEAWYSRVQKAAGAKLTDQKFLEIIAVERYSPCRSAAIAKLTNQKLLGKLAVEEESPLVRKTALKYLTDPNFLRIIATEDKSWEVRVAAVEKLKDQKLLGKIAVEDEHFRVRAAAVEKLTDHKLIEKIADEDETPWVSSHAKMRLIKLKRTKKEKTSPYTYCPKCGTYGWDGVKCFRCDYDTFIQAVERRIQKAREK